MLVIAHLAGKPENTNITSSLNDAISHFKINLDKISCKNIFPIATPRTQSQATSIPLDISISQSVSLNNFKLPTNKRMLIGSIPEIDTTKIKQFVPSQPNFEAITIKPIPQSSFNIEKNLPPISTQSIQFAKGINRAESPTNSSSGTLSSSISGTLKHFRHSTQDSFASQDNLVGPNDLFEKIVKNFCDETDLTYFFSKFATSFGEKIKNLDSVYSNELESACKTMLEILNKLITEDKTSKLSGLKETLNALLDDKLEYIEKMIQPGFINMYLFTLTLAGWTLADDIKDIQPDYDNNIIFRSKLIEISNEALIVFGHSFKYKSKTFKIDGFFDDFDRVFQKYFKKDEATLLINRNRWRRTKNFFLEASKIDFSEVNSSLIDKHLERRALAVRACSYIEEELEKLTVHQVDIVEDEELDTTSLEITLDFIILDYITIDKLIIPHSIIFI